MGFRFGAGLAGPEAAGVFPLKAESERASGDDAGREGAREVGRCLDRYPQGQAAGIADAHFVVGDAVLPEVDVMAAVEFGGAEDVKGIGLKVGHDGVWVQGEGSVEGEAGHVVAE